MTILPPDCRLLNQPPNSKPVSGLEKTLRILSIVTMIMTIPQILTIWIGGNANGVSLLSWVSYLFTACVWFVYGIRKRDKTIYLACIGWVFLDAAVVIGVIVYS
jgi:uncharacterized protein with PQ loop repeat